MFVKEELKKVRMTAHLNPPSEGRRKQALMKLPSSTWRPGSVAPRGAAGAGRKKGGKRGELWIAMLQSSDRFEDLRVLVLHHLFLLPSLPRLSSSPRSDLQPGPPYGSNPCPRFSVSLCINFNWPDVLFSSFGLGWILGTRRLDVSKQGF